LGWRPLRESDRIAAEQAVFVAPEARHTNRSGEQEAAETGLP
jgi:hypothetical protein